MPKPDGMQDDKPISWGAGAKVAAILIAGVIIGRQVNALETTGDSNAEDIRAMTAVLDAQTKAVEIMKTVLADQGKTILEFDKRISAEEATTKVVLSWIGKERPDGR